ncbi:MAG: pyridoxal phosphate-dependent decarboxylase family protein [Candidatus Kapaibacterium sp.]
MDINEFRKNAHRAVDWIADYYENIEKFPVKSQVAPGDIYKRLKSQPPANGESFERIFDDFQNIIMPGITHWQSPNFFAYFPANSSFPSILGEMLTAALGAQCMIWETSPAAAELEEMTAQWLGRMIGLPSEFHGVIQDTASTATLVSLLTARELASDFEINKHGYAGSKFRVYCSAEAHSSIEKDVKIAGIGRDNLVKIPADSNFAMIPSELRKAIEMDIAAGLQPLAIVAALGTTSSCAIDPLDEISRIAERYRLWLHVDAAYAGSALVLDEYRPWLQGIGRVDSFVFNPHKWMFTNFDCSVYFVRNKEALIRTFEIMPEYLKTGSDTHVKNYRDWGVQLGRRFRALKLWFVIRSFGTEGIKSIIRKHIENIQTIKKLMESENDFEILAPVNLNLICFRYHPDGIENQNELNHLNEKILQKINSTGEIYMTHTKLAGNYVMRLVAGQTHVEMRHLDRAWEIIRASARNMT